MSQLVAQISTTASPITVTTGTTTGTVDTRTLNSLSYVIDTTGSGFSGLTVQQQVQNGTSGWVSLGTAITIGSASSVALDADVSYTNSKLIIGISSGTAVLKVSTCGKLNQ